MWEPIMIPVYQVWSHGLYELHGPSYVLSEKSRWIYSLIHLFMLQNYQDIILSFIT